MNTFLLAGTVLGAFIGFCHMLIVLAARLGRPEFGTSKTVWQGIWTWGLWTLFGAYVLAFWLIGLICMGLARLLSRKRGAA